MSGLNVILETSTHKIQTCGTISKDEKVIIDKAVWLRQWLSDEEPMCRSYALLNPNSNTAIFMSMVDARDEIIVSDDDYTTFVESAFTDGAITESKKNQLLDF